MILGWIFCIFTGISCVCAAATGNGAALAAAVAEGAQAGITLLLSLAGSLCLWSGIGRLMESAGITSMLARFLSPLLRRIFPGTQTDRQLADAIAGNVCANILGLGNAATPMGIRAVRQMAASASGGIATDEMCRLVVLNTASIQLIPTTVAAIRGALGSSSPFDILPAVWITGFISAGTGLASAWILGKVWPHA